MNRKTTTEIWKRVHSSDRADAYVSNVGRCKTVWRKSRRERIHYGTLNRVLGYRMFCG